MDQLMTIKEAAETLAVTEAAHPGVGIPARVATSTGPTNVVVGSLQRRTALMGGRGPQGADLCSSERRSDWRRPPTQALLRPLWLQHPSQW
jgi:hypothetical protein